jgi:hypothetical protein
MGDAPSKKPLHEIAMEIRNAMDDLLPEGIGVTINTSENTDSTGFVSLTIASWPKSMYMLNYDRVVADRIDLLEGRRGGNAHLPYLSLEASRLAESLQALLDQHFPPVHDETTGELKWSVTDGVAFDPNALERERIKIIQSLKGISK